MRNNYIVSNDFYIKDNLSSFLIYFDYFISTALPLTKYVSNSSLRKITYLLLRTIIIVAYITQIYKLRYKIEQRKDNAIIIFKGSGEWSNCIKLIEKKGKLKIIKKVFNKSIYLKEKKFYDKYKKNSSQIKIPECSFLNNNTIEMEFLKIKSFQRSIVDGTFDFNISLKHYNKIKEELKIFYGRKITLIHGDFWLTNIFIQDNTYYLIDFSDSFVNSYNYDLYVLLYGILTSYNYIDKNEKTIIGYSHKGISIMNIIGIKIRNLKEIERQFAINRSNRFPSLHKA